MYYLVDTNVFLHVIDSNIYGVADLCKKNNNDITITQTILNELDPGYYKENEDASSKEIYTSVNNLVLGTWGIKAIRIIRLSDIEGAKEELKKIRERFYSWMSDPQYLQKLIQEGKISRDDIKKPSFRKKDLGECELLAIAKASMGQYWIVTNDRGRVFQHPDQNIFDTYANDPNVTIITGEEWLKIIGFNKESEQQKKYF